MVSLNVVLMLCDFPMYHTQLRINLDIQRVVGYQQWCNKLWNAIRFAMSKLEDNYVPCTDILLESMPFSCRWILSVLNKAVSKTVGSLELYEFSDAATAVYSWWQFQLCDIFIELIKPYFTGANQEFDSARSAARDTLWICLDSGLRLLHPFMPYVTEELWQRLPKAPGSCSKESIMISSYPSVVEGWTSEIESEMDLVEGIVKSLRSLRSQLPPNQRYEKRQAYVVCQHATTAEIIKCRKLEILTLASLSSLEVLGEYDAKLTDCGVEVVNEYLSVYLELHGALNPEAELKKLKKREEELRKQRDSLLQVMNAYGYKQKVPQEVDKANCSKLETLEQELKRIDEAKLTWERSISVVDEKPLDSS